MKLHSLFFYIILFVLVSVFFICPSLLSVFINYNGNPSFTEWSFPLQQAILFLIACLIYFVTPNLKQEKKITLPKAVYFVFFIITPFIFTFLLLFCNSLVFSFLSTLDFFKISTEIPVSIPYSFTGWIWCILNFFFAAFFEEIIYRYYFIDELNVFFNKSDKKTLRFIFELAGLLIFSLSHFYMGILSVFNAAIAHVILRLCYKKSGSIVPGFLAHFCYNIISLILL